MPGLFYFSLPRRSPASRDEGGPASKIVGQLFLVSVYLSRLVIGLFDRQSGPDFLGNEFKALIAKMPEVRFLPGNERFPLYFVDCSFPDLANIAKHNSLLFFI
jgi:hypothetical protein